MWPVATVLDSAFLEDLGWTHHLLLEELYRGRNFEARLPGFEPQFLPRTSSVTLHTSLNLSGPQFAQLYNEGNHRNTLLCCYEDSVS